MNSNINEVTQSIGKKVVVITNNLDEIRKLLKELKQTENNINTNTTIQNEDIPVQEGTLENTEEAYMYDGNDLSMNSSFNNKSYPKNDNVVPNLSIVPITREKSESNLLNIFNPENPYDDKKIQEYHDVASKWASSEELKPDKKYNIIINAEKRHDYLKRNKTSDQEKEFQELDDIFEICEKNGFCQKIKDNWMSIQKRRSFNSTGSPRSPPESTQSTPRSQVKQGWRGGIKTRKTSHQKTKRSRTNKKSRTHKKRH
jgi:hypothetical protein